MNKYIFLDIDGVLVSLNHMNSIYALARENNDFSKVKDVDGENYFDPTCLNWLNWLVKKTSAKIVITSTWRRTSFCDIEMMKFIFHKRGFDGEIVGYTPNYINDRILDRGDEIKAYVKNNLNETDKFLILDDEARNIVDYYPNNFILVDTFFGLHRENAKQGLKILNK